MSDEAIEAAAPQPTPALAEAPKADEAETLMNPNDFRIGFDRDQDPDVMIFNVPLKRCADDLEYGSAILRGKLEEAKQIALNHISQKRQRKAMLTGLARPGAPLGTPRGMRV